MEVVMFSTFSTVMEVMALWVYFMAWVYLKGNLLSKLCIYLSLMEGSDKREPVILYEVPLLPEQEIKALIIKALPQGNLSPQHLVLRKKEGKYQAFVMVPSAKAQEILAQKQIIINKEAVCIKKSFVQAQVFISRIPDAISIDDIRHLLEQEFGKIVKIHEGQPHEETKMKLKHCYVQFEKDQDAQKCLFSYKKLKIKDFELKPSRAYGMSETDETDKKLFLKVTSQFQDQDDLERTINQQFRKEGKLREKIRIENGKATIIYTSPEVADKVLHGFKGGKIGKYDVVLRPYANKDSYTVFMPGLKNTVTQEDLERTFKDYKPLISCSIQPSNANPMIKNGTITFGCQDTYKRLLVEYKEKQEIVNLYAGRPYMTQHMNAKDRNQYNSFVKGKGPSHKPEKKQMPLLVPPFQMYSNPPTMPPMPNMPPNMQNMPNRPNNGMPANRNRGYLQKNQPNTGPMGQMGMGPGFYQQM